MAEVRREKGIGWDALKLKVDALKNLEGKVGWFPDAQYEDGTPVAYAMSVQELGYSGGRTFRIPPRPFFRPTIVRERQNWARLASDLAKQALRPGSNISGLDLMTTLCERARGDVLKTINSITTPALSKVTLELRAMKLRDPGLRVTRSTVYEAIRRVRKPGYTSPSVNDKPLEDTGHAISTLDISVTKV